MDKIRDFFYNKNDIVVAILILIVAAALIYFRINAIMNYPAVMAANNNAPTAAEPAKEKADDGGNKEIKE